MSFKRKVKRHKPWNPKKLKSQDWLIPESIAKPALKKWIEDIVEDTDAYTKTGQEMAT